MLPTVFKAMLLLLLAALLPACNFAQPKTQPRTQDAWVEESGSTMGSTYRLQFVNPFSHESKQKLVELIQAQRGCLHEIESLISTWKADSQLSAFNRHATTDWYPVDLRTVETVELAAKLSAIDKRFDVTVAPLSELWGFGPADRRASAPQAAEIDDCMKHVGSDKLEYRREPPALRKTDPRLRIDLSGLAAGYVADKLAQMLISQGVNDFYIDIAGEIVTSGRNRRGEKWRVGIAEPIVGSKSIHSKLDLTDCAIATSGNYRNYVEINGQRLGHILNPTTGRPVATDVLSATVIHASCAQADAIATLLMTMTAAEGLALANQHAWCVLLLVDAEGEVKELRSDKKIDSSR